MRALFRDFKALLPPSAIFVAAPDHPLILDGPEAMVGHDGHGLAIMAHRRQETVDMLSARLMACRLLLSSHWGCVLVYKDVPAGQIAERFDLCLGGRNGQAADHLVAALNAHRDRSGASFRRLLVPCAFEFGEDDEAVCPGALSDMAQIRAELPEGTHVEAADLGHPPTARRVWLNALTKAYAWDGCSVVPSNQPAPVILATAWPADVVQRHEMARRFSVIGAVAVPAQRAAAGIARVFGVGRTPAP